MYGDSSISSSYVRREESPVYFQSAVLVTLVTVFLWSSLTKTLPWLQEEWRGFFVCLFCFFLLLHFRTPTGNCFHCSNGKVWKRSCQKICAIVRHKTW